MEMESLKEIFEKKLKYKKKGKACFFGTLLRLKCCLLALNFEMQKDFLQIDSL